MYSKLDITDEWIKESKETHRIEREWDRLNRLQAKAFREARLPIHTDKTTKEVEKLYGCDHYKYEDWKEFYTDHWNRLKQLEAIDEYVNGSGRLPTRIEKKKGCNYD